jgi:hypothetical protein
MISTQLRICSLCALVALSVTLLGPARAKAGAIDSSTIPIITIQADDGNHIYTPSTGSYSATSDDGDFALTNSIDLGGLSSSSVKVEQLEFNNDPFVLNNFLVTNNLGVPQVFSVFVGLPATLAAPNTISGNVRASVIDGGTDGASITSVAGSPIYQAQVDFATVATLQNDPFIVAAVPGGSNTASATFGPTASGVAVTSTIGVQLRFMLSPGDTASILSRFDVIPGGPNGGLPEPTTLTLGGIVAMLGIGLRGRRSS